jgi:RNA-binding protein
MAKTKNNTEISSQDIRELRSKLHHLKPVVIIGDKGLTGGVLQEIERALNDHELIKVRAHIEEREELEKIMETVCAKTKSVHVQTIGHIIAFYRKAPTAE